MLKTVILYSAVQYKHIVSHKCSLHIILNFWMATLKKRVKLTVIYIYFTQYILILLFQHIIDTEYD